MFAAWVVFHIITCIALVLVVLLQSSKGEGLAGSAFGGSGLGGAVFGGRGAAGFLAKATSYLAVLFMLNCGVLAFMSASTDLAGTPGAPPSEVHSPITEQAQEDREQSQQQQQFQTDSTPPPGVPVEPVDGPPPTTPTETDGQ